jgi:hypothetical protein
LTARQSNIDAWSFGDWGNWSARGSKNSGAVVHLILTSTSAEFETQVRSWVGYQRR